MGAYCKLILFLLFVLPNVVWANVSLNAIFSNHMVVQRETKIPVWGWAEAGEKITLETTWGEKEETIAKENGTWKITLKTPKAGGPFKIIITGKNKIVIDDVLSGEVWLCTGQSNMDFALVKFLNNARESQYQPLVEVLRKEVANANDDQLRHIEVPQQTSLLKKQYNFKGAWVSAKGEDVKKITATGYFFAKELRKQLRVPVGLVECSWGGTRVQPWISEEVYLSDENIKAYFEASRKKTNEIITKVSAENYKDTVFAKKFEEWKLGGKKTPRPYPSVHPEKDKQLPATLYNGMLSAIIPYKIKGILWYQGESNSHFLEEEYQTYFTAMIKSWRKDWQQSDLPFYWMQLAGYEVPDKRSDLGWASVNDQLRRTLDLPNTGMAVLHDIGEAKDVHPHNKIDAGKRLALWALAKDYHKKVKAVSGPLFTSQKIKGNKIQIKFSEVGSGLMVGYKYLLENTKEVNEDLKWFEIVGADGVWKPAKAKIISKNKVEVWNLNVKKPIAVRYAWSSNPSGANLYNKEGLPAAVFTSEK
ncbi:hypothetical protein AXE80_03595 [Wenyingzhuangia fucanilytica]|uniref:Sialate O-acetylesterase domain-containing protein n=1 Tax=Wenyingzhuangia fucanilytica TaxID=1790137 RepID=A0A1B1Y3V3_9FLAO|nr:sialate O-acetylesterase [Wenyingzhuangia fucanilytica]ANW95418.1 hypothetical protein AXE80_03595 [Wenyingzhuangia fucanilytica]